LLGRLWCFNAQDLSSQIKSSENCKPLGLAVVSVADEASLDILALYQSDVGDRILSFASSVELCADLV